MQSLDMLQKGVQAYFLFVDPDIIYAYTALACLTSQRGNLLAINDGETFKALNAHMLLIFSHEHLLNL